jgi:hypothetical protein
VDASQPDGSAVELRVDSARVNAPEVKLKRFLVVPRDALELLTRRYADLGDAQQAAEELCAEEGQSLYVLEMKLVAARATPPVKVRKL